MREEAGPKIIILIQRVRSSEAEAMRGAYKLLYNRQFMNISISISLQEYSQKHAVLGH